MQASNKSGAATHQVRGRDECERLANAVLDGALGQTVRCTPMRCTTMFPVASEVWFGKVRHGGMRAAIAEWRWLHELPAIGLAVPEPLAFVRRGRRSVLVTSAVNGRPLDVVIAEAMARGEHAAIADFACQVVAVAVAALHASGLVYRDLYWNHLFVDRLGPGARLVFLDVERVFAPRVCRRRWHVKDLAGLVSSFPGTLSPKSAMRFLRAYLLARGDAPNGRALRRWLFVHVGAKSKRIRAHVPKYG